MGGLELGQDLELVFKTITEDDEADSDSEYEEQARPFGFAEDVANSNITDIQNKLYQKILPILERHMSDQP
jgi:hypothetical protein